MTTIKHDSTLRRTKETTKRTDKSSQGTSKERVEGGKDENVQVYSTRGKHSKYHPAVGCIVNRQENQENFMLRVIKPWTCAQ